MEHITQNHRTRSLCERCGAGKKTIKKLSHIPCSMFHEEGFSLIELMVVMAIITIISAIFFLNLREGEGGLALQRSAQAVTQNISATINNSLGGKEHGGTVSSGGFGIIFEENSQDIIIFANCNENNALDSSGAASSCDTATEGTPYPELFTTYTLEGTIEVSSLSPCTGTPCTLTITFQPPNPDVVFVPALVGSEAQVTLQNIRGRTIDVFVNTRGVTRIVQ